MIKRPILIAGLPASGKSILAKKLKGKILEFDDIALKFGSYDELNEERDFANKYFQLITQFGKYDIIVDTFHTCESRKNILSILPIKPNLIFVSCSLEECLRRNELRSKSLLSNEELINIFYSYEPIRISEGFNRIVVYDSIKDINFTMEQIMKTFEEDPEVKDGFVYLKIDKDKINAYGDLQSLIDAENEQNTGKLFDVCLTHEEWKNADYTARIVDGELILGLPDDVLRERQESAIRSERYLRLRKIDKLNNLYWEELTEEKKQALRDYRHALLDITDQEGFPWNGNIDIAPWPEKPDFFDF